jgi:hypothetical protein
MAMVPIFQGTILLKALCMCMVLANVTSITYAQDMAIERHMVRRAQECASYTPIMCTIATTIKSSHCPSCAFDVHPALECPLPAAGYFTYSTGSSEGGGCPDAFMAQTHHLPPPCGARCCRTAHVGAFSPFDDPQEATQPASTSAAALSAKLLQAPPPRLEFQPTDSSCRYKLISRGQLMRYLAHHNSSLLFVGDSTQRQLFLRLVAMLRGQPRLVDFHIHTHAQYQLCREVDFFRIAAPNPRGSAAPSDARFLKSVNPAFFDLKVGPGQADARRVLSECTHPPLRIDFVQAPMWAAQTEAIRRYAKGLRSGQRPVIVLSVGLWQQGGEPPETFLEALQALRNSTNPIRVFYVGTPTSNVVDTSRRQQLEARNAKIKEWMESQGHPFAWVDFDALASADGAPRGTRGSKHYGCWLEWQNASFPLGASGNPPGSAQATGVLGRVHTDLSGQCSDEMNRNLMEVILNGLIDNAALTSWSPALSESAGNATDDGSTE